MTALSMLLVLATLALLVPALAAGGTWTTRLSLPTHRNDLAASAVGGKIYFIGGFRTDGTASADNEVFDTATNTWEIKAPMPTPRGGLGTGVVNGVIYAVGGHSSGTELNTVEAYDPVTDTWTARTSMPTARTSLAIGVIDGVIYAAGGQIQGGIPLTTVEAYNPVANTWSMRAPLNVATTHFDAAVVGGILYAIAGTGGGFTPPVQAYDPATNVWTTKSTIPNSPGGYIGFGTGVLCDMIYVVGGATGNPSQFISAVQVYDPATDTWTTDTSLPEASGNFGAAVASPVLYVGGGYTNHVSGDLLSFVGNQPPIAEAGAHRTLACTSSSGASVQLNGAASMDPDGDTLSYHWDAPGVTLDNPNLANPTGTFPIGISMATLTVADGCGGLDVDDVVITVVDADPPQVLCTTNLAALWPPNHNLVPVALFVQATDNCTAPQNLVLLSVTIRSDEADDANGVGDGETSGDVNGADGFSSSVEVSQLLSYNPDSQRFEGIVGLRAERDGNGDGRAYTIKAWVLDTQNNIGYASCAVVVPLNQKKK